ncbi:hypothetical protein C2845_PM12G09720 [Panicum miliaceum]|uniref:Uncharacterized protein n=1 Tax=Panicum miliaceum TaxID=4540 RepID=A0A3L6QC22_PANMI|nr:hypothetical protein C2845_PM12G09720 [Panicum miliaceum]
MNVSKAIGVINGINEFDNFFQMVRSAVSYMRSQWNGSQEKKLQEGDVLQLQSDLRCLGETLPAMYNLIDLAEWKSHVPCVEQLLPNLKDAVYDAEDLLDEFRYVTQGSFNKVACIQRRLSNLSSQLEKMGSHEATPRLDKSLRPEDGRCWRKFCAPLKLQGSMSLVTTRCAEVADIVGTMDSFALEGLNDDVFWHFFKLCVFGSEDYHIDPQLELIGRSIVPKLKGSPLAAKTIGRLLRKSLKLAHWNDILNSEMWRLRQKENDILPALRLSYMYLPFHLKRCFSFCAVYPKDYNFEKASLAEIWVAEGFVEPQGNIPLQHIGDQYFEDLVNLSFFQKLHGKYVIHDLMHDMAQLVSKEECFIVKNASDIEMVPQNVRHLSILRSGDVKFSNLWSLCKHTKLRTLLCNKSLGSETLHPVMDHWFSGLQHLRVIFCASTKRLPESIGNLKHLRYLEISSGCHFDSFPHHYVASITCRFYMLGNANLEDYPEVSVS